MAAAPPPSSSAPPAPPGPAGPAKRVLLDELVVDRTTESVPAAPTLQVEPVPVEALESKGRRRVQELEEVARRNHRAADEARRALAGEHERLEAEAAIRRKMEKEAGRLRRELERLRESESLRVAQARYAAEKEAQEQVRSELDARLEEFARTEQEVERLRGAIDDDRALMADFSERLREEQQAKAKARAEADRAREACQAAERSLEFATETARRRAEDELDRLATAEQAVRDALAERDRLAAQVAAMSDDNRVSGLVEKVTELEKVVRERDAQLVAEQQRSAAAGHAAADFEQRLAAAAVEIDDGRIALARVSELESETARLGAEVERLEALSGDAKALDDQIERAKKEAASAHTRMEKLQTELQSLTDDRDAALARVRAVESQLEHQSAELSAALEARDANGLQVSELGDALRAAEAARDELLSECAQLNEQLVAARADIATSRAVIEPADDKVVAELERALSDEQARLREAEAELRRLRESDSAAAGDVETGRAEIEQLRAQLVAHESRYAEAQAELLELRSQLQPAVLEPEVAKKPEPKAAKKPQAEPEAALDRKPAKADETTRRSVMAELHAIAAIDGEDVIPRRR